MIAVASIVRDDGPPLLPVGKPLYSIQEAAAVLRIGRSTFYRRIGSGEIKTHRIGGKVVVRRDDLERLIEAG